MLDLAMEKGIRRFDTAPGYESEAVLGEFITANGLKDEAIVLTKIPSLEGSSNYQNIVRSSIETSLNHLGCRVDVLFFHNPTDSVLLKKEPDFFENLLHEYPISNLGVSVYEAQEVEAISSCQFDLAFQFPFNVLDRRFANVDMREGKRYARSIFLQGLLASSNRLRSNTPSEILNLKKEYHKRLAKYNLDPVEFTISFMANNDAVDYFLIGVDTEKQLQDILELEPYELKDMVILDKLQVKTTNKWLDPREWN